VVLLFVEVHLLSAQHDVILMFANLLFFEVNLLVLLLGCRDKTYLLVVKDGATELWRLLSGALSFFGQVRVDIVFCRIALDATGKAPGLSNLLKCRRDIILYLELI
jgi:hypothetical protein